jgi:GNAT superfamily N-acetyltransferase
MALETEALVLPRERVLRGVQRVFSDPGRGRYYVAQQNSQVLACLLITFEWSDWRDAWYWWIQSVYVAPHARRVGVFRTLYEYIQIRARETGKACGLRLYVERGNSRAQSTYSQLGMHETHYCLYEESFE